LITLLWESGNRAARELLESAARRHDLDLVRVPRGGLARLVLPCLATGAVIVVVRDDAEASRALGLGVDEVVRTTHLSSDALDGAIHRARVRAEARVVREAFMRKTSGEDDAIALRLLARAVSHEVNNPLQALVLDVESLAHAVWNLVELNTKVSSWLLTHAPEIERRKFKEQLRSTPDPAELEDIFDNMRECLRRAAQAMHRFGALTYEASEQVSVGSIATELVEILRDEVSAQLSLEVKGQCIVSVSRPTLVCVIGALMAHALEAVGEARESDRRVALRVSEEEGAVLIEIEHGGIAVPADLRPNVFQPYFSRNRANLQPTGLQGIRERARRWGGDFLVLNEKSGTTLRLIIPKMDRTAGEAEVLESVPRLRLDDLDD
jgi:C4-dicarboxylate-specific signal transduction histidine kinase